jgi:hypothetical protein
MSAPAKPRVRIDREGWIRWTPAPRPVPEDQEIEFRTADGFESSREVSRWVADEVPDSWWDHSFACPDHHVTHFRIVGEPA